MEPFVHLDDLQVHMLSSHENTMDTPVVEDKKDEIFKMDEDKLA